MPNKNSKSTNIVKGVWWDKAGDVTDKDFTDEQFTPELTRLIRAAQKDIAEVIRLAACQKAKTVGKFNRMKLSVKITPEIEFDIATATSTTGEPSFQA